MMQSPDVSGIKFIVLDIDGTLTDGGIYISEAGDEFKKFNVKDGMAIKRLIQNGLPVAFLSASKSVVPVTRRAEMLGVKYCYVGSIDKTTILESWMKELGITYEQVLYMGDDINDLEVIKKAKVGACPADATPVVREAADLVLTRNGGDACFRELVDQYFPLV